MEKVYFNQPYLQLYADQDKQLVRAVWNGFLSSTEIETGSFWCLKLLDELKPLFWIADNRKMKAIRQHDQEWIVSEIGPHLAASSIRKMATLVSEDIFNQMAVEHMFSRASSIIKFDHRYFKSENEAMTWISQNSEQNRTMKMA